MNNLVRITCILIFLLLLLPRATFAQLDFTSSNIPIIVIDTDSQNIVDEYRIVANMGIINNEEGQINRISDPFNDYSGRINIEIRGSSSQTFPKKSFAFETQDDNDNVRNVSLLGLPVENDWILYAPYSDKSLIRNILSYRLSRELGHYAPRTKLCELVLNGEYRGVYVLIEKIKRDDNRLDIAKLKAGEISGDDLTGGYIIKTDKKTGDTGPVWSSEMGNMYFQFEYPKHDEIVPEQENYIKSYLYEFEQSLISDQFLDSEFGYRKYIDANSFVDFFIINELSRNIDGYFLSTFFYKDKDSKGGKLCMGPIWDFNLTFGIPYYRDGFKINGFQVKINPNTLWWDRLLQDPSFIDDIKNRWYGIRESNFSNENIIVLIDSLSLLLEEPQGRNFEKWNNMGTYTWPNYYVSESYEDEIDYLLTWTLNRLQWLDNRLIDWNSARSAISNFRCNAYPNPFSSFFYYDLSLSRPGHISLTLYDLRGMQLAKIVNDVFYTAGSYTLEWQTSDLPGGVYSLVLRVDGNAVSIKKIVKL